MPGPLNLEQILTFLLDTPMFGGLDPSELSQIVHIMQVQHLRTGQVLFAEGTPGDAWYVLYDGEVEVQKDPGDGERVIATLGPRACFGEMAILDGSPRSATVVAARTCTVFRFPRADFLGLLEADNLAAYKLVYQMALVLVARQRQTTSELVGVLRSNQDDEVKRGLTPIVEVTSLSE